MNKMRVLGVCILCPLFAFMIFLSLSERAFLENATPDEDPARGTIGVDQAEAGLPVAEEAGWPFAGSPLEEAGDSPPGSQLASEELPIDAEPEVATLVGSQSSDESLNQSPVGNISLDSEMPRASGAESVGEQNSDEGAENSTGDDLQVDDQAGLPADSLSSSSDNLPPGLAEGAETEATRDVGTASSINAADSEVLPVAIPEVDNNNEVTPVTDFLAASNSSSGLLEGPEPMLDFFTKSCDQNLLGYAVCPRLFVLGAQKGGTTTFFSYMESHRDFRPAMPLDGGSKRVKELSYFIHARPEDPNDARREVVQNYLPFFPKRTDAKEWTSDATPTTMYDPNAPKSLINAGMRKGARFVMLLRDPVERAISNMEKRVRGGEKRDAPSSYNLTTVVETCVPLLKKCRAEASGPGVEGLGYFHCYNTLSWDNLWMDLCETINKGFYVDLLKHWLIAGYDGRREFCVLSTSQFLESPERAARETGLNERCLAETGVDLSGFPEWKELPDDQKYNVHNTDVVGADAVARQRLHDFFAPANAELKQLLADSFGVSDFTF